MLHFDCYTLFVSLCLSHFESQTLSVTLCGPAGPSKQRWYCWQGRNDFGDGDQDYNKKKNKNDEKEFSDMVDHGTTNPNLNQLEFVAFQLFSVFGFVWHFVFFSIL